MDADTLVFPSTAVDPNQPISPEIAKNGNIYNVWTLNLKTNELKQFTDALGGNVSPVVLRDENKAQQIAFITYYKGEYGIHTVPAQKEPLHTVATRRLRRARADHRLPAAAQPHAGEGRTSRPRGGSRSCSSRGGRRSTSASPAAATSSAARRSPSPTCSATSSSTSTPSRCRSTARCRCSYLNLSRRFQYALQGFSQTQFYYANNAGTFYAAQYRLPEPRATRSSTQTARGGTDLRHLPAEPLRAARDDRPG